MGGYQGGPSKGASGGPMMWGPGGGGSPYGLPGMVYGSQPMMPGPGGGNPYGASGYTGGPINLPMLTGAGLPPGAPMPSNPASAGGYGNYGGPAPGVYASGGGDPNQVPTSAYGPQMSIIQARTAMGIPQNGGRPNPTAAFLMSPQGQQLMNSLRRGGGYVGPSSAPMGTPNVPGGSAPIVNRGYNTPVYRGG